MNEIKLYVNEDDYNIDERLDYYLSTEIDEISRTYIKELIKEKKVKVNNKFEKPKYKVQAGDLIVVEVPEPKNLQVLAQDIPLDIVYEDEDLLVINKSQNMVVHPAPGNYENTLVNALLYHVDRLSSINGIIRPGIVHRLDKDTSGLLIVAKNNESHKFLSEKLKERKLKREYIALVHGNINQAGTINLPIGRDPKDRKKMTVINTNSKEAITHYKILENFNDYTLLSVKLETGRTHQIRVHMSHINRPIVGDQVYCNKKNKFKLEGQLLHAKKIGFIHPRTKDYMEFETEIPSRFIEVIKKIKNNIGGDQDEYKGYDNG